MAEADFTGKVTAFLEGFFGLPGEAHDDVGGEIEVGAEGLDALAHLPELRRSVKAMHAFQSVF